MEGLSIPITGATYVLIAISIVGYFCKYFFKDKLEEIRARRQAFISHIEACNEKNIAFALLEQKVRAMAAQIDSDRAIRHWMGDCMQNIAGKLNVDLPERPQ